MVYDVGFMVHGVGFEVERVDGLWCRVGG
jgi:hypothetical protein